MHNKLHDKPHVIIVTGPTASGKTNFAEQLAHVLPIEMVNADVGQFYTPLTIGTAKPDWRSLPFKSHLFDILDTPHEISVTDYRQQVLPIVQDIVARGKVPVIVGGSLFYLKALMFPPQAPVPVSIRPESIDFSQDAISLWSLLQEIDPERAAALHPNDRYRIERALMIWQETGSKPSQLVPLYDPPFHTTWVFMQPALAILEKRIYVRTQQMVMTEGWIDETRALLDTPWEAFVQQKGFIGYAELIKFLRGELVGSDVEDVIALIGLRTRQYARRQLIFLKKFMVQLEEHRSTAPYLQESITLAEWSVDRVNVVVAMYNDLLGRRS
jgi:tRNA dimethylallyltransferase